MPAGAARARSASRSARSTRPSWRELEPEEAAAMRARARASIRDALERRRARRLRAARPDHLLHGGGRRPRCARAASPGRTALEAAGRVHTDMQAGFVRAEVIGWEELVEAGSFARARELGTAAHRGPRLRRRGRRRADDQVHAALSRRAYGVDRDSAGPGGPAGEHAVDARVGDVDPVRRRCRCEQRHARASSTSPSTCR